MFYREIHGGLESGSQYEEPGFAPQGSGVSFVDAEKHPVIAAVNVVAARLLEILGPILWAALIALFLAAAFSSN